MSYEAWGEPEDDYRSVDRLLEEGWLPADEISAALSAVIDERVRQESVEGWTAAHDDEHKSGELAGAGAAYAVAAYLAAQVNAQNKFVLSSYQQMKPPPPWPFEPKWWKPKNPRADLVRAAALLIAEIERIDRATSKAKDDANAP